MQQAGEGKGKIGMSGTCDVNCLTLEGQSAKTALSYHQQRPKQRGGLGDTRVVLPSHRSSSSREGVRTQTAYESISDNYIIFVMHCGVDVL